MDLIEDDSIHMLSWDDGLLEPIVLHDSYEIDGVSLVPQTPAPFSLIPDEAPFQLTHPAPLVIRCQDAFVPFTLWPEDDDSAGREIQIVTRSGRIAQPPLPALQSTQARISIWSLLASSSTHRDVLIRALSQIRVETTTTPEGLIHMMTAGRATCIVFSDDDLPPDGLDHVRPLYITVGCSGRRVPSVLLDNGSALNVCLLATAIALGFASSDFGLSTQTVRAYDSTKKEVMGTLMIDLQIGPTTFPLCSRSSQCALPGIYLPLLSQYFRSVTHSSTVVLDMMRGMTFLPGMGLGRRQQGPSEFIAAIDHDMTFGLGFIPTEADYRHMHGCARRGGSETRPRLEEIDSVVHIDRETELNIYFTSYIPDEMDMMTMSQVTSIVQLQPISAFDMFGVSTIEDQPRELKIGSPLSIDERDRLIHLLRSYLDVFAWPYEDMPGLDPSIVQHHLPTLPHARPVKQKLRRLHPRWSLQVKEEIQKQLSVGFISVVEYPEWLANVVPVPKKDGKVRVCVDFRDLNKVSPKDDFPLPHIDLLVDGTAGHSMLSFMDGFSGSHLSESRYHFVHDMMHRDVEVYVDDMIVKSRGRADHLDALERFFERIRKFRLRLNPKKCTFGVTSGKLLGHMVSERGIEVDRDKIKAILDMLAPKTEKEIRSFLGRLQYINRFIARLTDILPPTPGRPLLLYLSVSDMALGCMLAQIDDSGKERAIYYLSKRMLEYEVKYVMIEHLCLALVWATRRLRHYMTEYSVHLISRLDPLRYLFDRPALTGRLMRWLVLLTEFDIHQSVRVWIGVCWVSPQGDHISRFVRLAFHDRHPITNNIVEYEACILGLETALELGIRQMEVFGDSNLICSSARAQNLFADALATLASSVDIPIDVVIRPLLIESRSAPAYCCLIGEIDDQDDLPWYHDIYQFLRSGTYPEVATTKDQRALEAFGY
ncbi:Retrovirus-related Pol polyprotein from transposon 17.6 [Vitis vinifera]|uniref:Retrovirus-related Pol polyprotein from transposon 17.6 n=1 Tax=Vitis vinifera TaxID=29760 RepID=A0A438GBE4_VITVI|nr:Retrovirus-related Pol polyprotein from transposon 17.6 [Vitis vinifera]